MFETHPRARGTAAPWSLRDLALNAAVAVSYAAVGHASLAEANTAYYVADTREALTKQGIIENVGGFLGIGRTQVPTRNLDLTAFTPIDVRHVSEISLPRAGKRYRVITPQNLAALDMPADSKGRLVGAIKIRDAQQFWARSKFLILVEQ